jgi:hypothetical protein
MMNEPMKSQNLCSPEERKRLADWRRDMIRSGEPLYMQEQMVDAKREMCPSVKERMKKK